MPKDQARKPEKKPEDSWARESPNSAVVKLGSRINNLAPPPTTSFYSSRSHAFLYDREMGTSQKFGIVRWKADIYTYATGANPKEPNFSQKGGKLYIVMIHSGYVKIYNNFSADVWNRMRFEVYIRKSGLEPSLQLPSTETGTQVGDNYDYKIDFGHTMQMFRNNGNETFTFDAKYYETFSRICAKQTGSRDYVIAFGLENKKASTNHRVTEIYGLSVFTHTDPTMFPVVPGYKFEIVGNQNWSINGEWDLPLGF